MTNVELLLRWIPAPAPDPDPGFAGMTMPALDPDPGYFVMPDLISLPYEVTLILYFTRACPVPDTGASREKTGTAEAIADWGS